MKLSKETIELLKHYAAINPGLIVDPGSRIFSCAVNKTIRTVATVNENFPTGFAVSNLAQFLNVLSFVDEPDVEFTDEYAEIRNADNTQRIQYFFSDPKLVDQPNAELKVKLPEDVQFHVTAEQIQKLNKACGIMQLSDIRVFARDGEIYMSCLNKAMKSTSAFEMHVGSCEKGADTKFEVFFKRQNLKLTEHDFDVIISSKKVSVWNATNAPYDDLTFYIVLEADSTFE